MPPEQQPVVLVLEGEIAPSWNKLYSGTQHWSERSKEKNRISLLVRSAIDPNKARLFRCRVAITVRAYFDDGRRFLDPDNLAAKYYIDAIKGWYIEDDTSKYIASVTTMTAMDRNNPRVEIEIAPQKET